MRPFIVIPALVIVPFTAIASLKMITGDRISAVVVGLMIFLVAAAWLAAPPVSAPHTSNRTSS